MIMGKALDDHIFTDKNDYRDRALELDAKLKDGRDLTRIEQEDYAKIKNSYWPEIRNILSKD